MKRRPHAQIHLPPLSARDALTAIAVLERAIVAIWRAHGDAMAHLQSSRQLEARARHRGLSCCKLDVDTDADF